MSASLPRASHWHQRDPKLVEMGKMETHGGGQLFPLPQCWKMSHPNEGEACVCGIPTAVSKVFSLLSHSEVGTSSGKRSCREEEGVQESFFLWPAVPQQQLLSHRKVTIRPNICTIRKRLPAAFTTEAAQGKAVRNPGKCR